MIVLMYNIYGVMNITGYKKPTDEEFKKCYKTLFDLCPRPSDYKTNDYKLKVENSRRTFFELQEQTLKIERLPWEYWKPHPTEKEWEISNLGRVKVNGIIQRQIDKPDGSIGYLVLENYSSVEVYHLVADTFLDRKVGEYRAVHHINNDGYNNSEDNLIMLTKEQHDLIHKNEMGEL